MILQKTIILAHNYQLSQVQDKADFVGDSLELSRQATKIKAQNIIFCGVDFMAQTAAILNPDKKVVLANEEAVCPMAQMITVEKLQKLKTKHPKAAVVAYVNSSAEIKARSDICCTSANALKVVESLPQNEIIFVPDQHLGDWVASKTDKKIILYPGFCPTHQRITDINIKKLKTKCPRALVLVHPECNRLVVGLADQVLSTGQMIEFVRRSRNKEFIIATEIGILHKLKKQNPGKIFYPASLQAVCPNMKKTTLVKLKQAQETGEPVVKVNPSIAKKARRAIERMLLVK